MLTDRGVGYPVTLRARAQQSEWDLTTIFINERVAEIFADARRVQGAAVERLEAADVRDAAEKAWCAAKRATDALILARTGEEPRVTARTSDELDRLARQQPAVSSLQGRYYSRIHHLHGMCFYSGYCNDQTERRIRETSAYIDDAEALLALG